MEPSLLPNTATGHPGLTIAMKTVAILFTLHLTLAFAAIEVKDLSANYLRLSGESVDVCDSELTLTVGGNNTVAAADVKFDDADTNCTTGSLKFEKALPDNPLVKEALKDFPEDDILLSTSSVTCTKKGENFTFTAIGLKPIKNFKVLGVELPTERVAVILQFPLAKTCLYGETRFSICFPATAQVKLANGATKTMNQLHLNDEVHVGGGRTSRIFMFTHALADAPALFTKLTTASSNTVTLTPSHHLYVNGQNIAARNVRVGDTLELADGSISAVVKVQAVSATGLYNPQTMHGDIIVDGIRVSTYTETVYPRAAHALLAPFRLAYQYARATCSAFESGPPNFRGLFAL